MSTAVLAEVPRTTTPPALRTRITRRVLAPVTATLTAVTVACAVVATVGGTVPLMVQVVPFAVSILVFGLPHGALDHLVPARLLPGTSVARSIAVVVLLYLVVGTGTAVLWGAAPLVGFWVFIGVTWFHWGQGDLFVDRLLDEGGVGRGEAALTVATRGALPMLVPFVAHPVAATTVVTGTVDVLRPGPHSAGIDTVPGPVRLALAALVLVLVALHVVAAHRTGRARRPATEDLVLLAFFAVVPPVLAVGLYFTLWHAVRHVLRLELTDPVAADALFDGRLWAPFLQFLRQAWPVTAIAVAMLVVLALVLGRADLGVYLVLIAALTTPHTVVVSWMDHVQRTWRDPAALPHSP